jgi:hypothetical protein
MLGVTPLLPPLFTFPRRPCGTLHPVPAPPTLPTRLPPRGDVRVSGLANTPSWVNRRRLTGRLWNTASCSTHSLTGEAAWVGPHRRHHAHRPALHQRRVQLHSLTHRGGCLGGAAPSPSRAPLRAAPAPRAAPLTHSQGRLPGWGRTVAITRTAPRCTSAACSSGAAAAAASASSRRSTVAWWCGWPTATEKLRIVRSGFGTS